MDKELEQRVNHLTDLIKKYLDPPVSVKESRKLAKQCLIWEIESKLDGITIGNYHNNNTKQQVINQLQSELKQLKGE